MDLSEVAGSWTHLVACFDTRATVATWAQVEPALAGLGGVADLAEVTGPGRDPGRADEVLAALVRLAACDGGDDLDAALVLVHLLGRGIAAVVAGLRDQGGDIVALVVGQVMVGIRSFPWQRRRTSIAANLLRDAQTAVMRELGLARRGRYRREREIPAAYLPSGWVQAGTEVPPQADAVPSAAEELVDLLVWAVGAGVAAPEDLQRLWEVKAASHGTRLRVHHRWEVSERTLRRRTAATLDALRSAAAAYLAA